MNEDLMSGLANDSCQGIIDLKPVFGRLLLQLSFIICVLGFESHPWDLFLSPYLLHPKITSSACARCCRGKLDNPHFTT